MGQFGRYLGAELRMRVQAGAHRRAADGQLVQAGQRRADLLLGQVQLRHVAGDLLAQRQRGGVLQMGAADLDDVVERRALGGQRAAQRLQGGQHAVLDLDRGGHVHGGRKGIVGRLAPVHVVVGVHLAAFAALAAQQLGGAVGQHLVHVHVALRARAGLPDRQRKLIGPLAGDHLIGGPHDGVCDLRIQLAQLGVDLGGGALQARHGGDQRHRHLLGRDREEMQRALGLRAPQVLLGHLDRAESVFFGAGFHGGTAPFAASWSGCRTHPATGERESILSASVAESTLPIIRSTLCVLPLETRHVRPTDHPLPAPARRSRHRRPGAPACAAGRRAARRPAGGTDPPARRPGRRQDGLHARTVA
ncbi:hypothetical protein KM22_03905 [Bordetella bronchiseptica KM22]|nr:hypothetical protein KM22_03905 [Bordetella bronchiseptica KM22]